MNVLDDAPELVVICPAQQAAARGYALSRTRALNWPDTDRDELLQALGLDPR